MPRVKNHFSVGNDLKTVLLHKSAFLCVTRFLPLSSFGFVNTFVLSHLAPFLPFYSFIPEILFIFARSDNSVPTDNVYPIAYDKFIRLSMETKDGRVGLNTSCKQITEKAIATEWSTPQTYPKPSPQTPASHSPYKTNLQVCGQFKLM